jgi:hypothetical protein
VTNLKELVEELAEDGSAWWIIIIILLIFSLLSFAVYKIVQNKSGKN